MKKENSRKETLLGDERENEMKNIYFKKIDEIRKKQERKKSKREI